MTDGQIINEMQFDVLREIGNIGSGNAATALAKMLNQKIDIKVPKAALCDFNQLPQAVGGEETIVVGILLTLSDDVEGMMMFIMKVDAAYNLLGKLMFTEIDKNEPLNEMQMSCLQEIGNIITGAYLSSLSDLTRLTIQASVPYMALDMAGAILSVPAIEFGKLGDKALMIEAEFGEDTENEIGGYFLLIPTLESYGAIMASLGIG
ncbi:MAG: chemotaxis protein CheC [Lachnospiraceae bacterium]|nr:chemotaxis protein CheC [Lachnospiraceae bacterium]MBP3608886.1 chemotaxis protein CheC [Lachnospiraceae bacterium]